MKKVFLPLLAVTTIFAIALSTSNKNFPISPSATPFVYNYKSPQIQKDRSYRTILVGDSITASLGANANELRLDLIKLFPGHEFVNYNYGYPATNVLSLPDRLTTKTSDKQIILKQGFDLIIIESFGYNPPSQYPLSEGLKKQTEALSNSVNLILKEKPGAALAFMTPIALSYKNYAKFTYDLTPEQRKQWVDERVAYINNHKQFAIEHGIPVIDVFSASLKSDGTVDESLISDDFIHPSIKGISLMSKTIADYIYQNKVFPE